MHEDCVGCNRVTADGEQSTAEGQDHREPSELPQRSAAALTYGDGDAQAQHRQERRRSDEPQAPSRLIAFPTTDSNTLSPTTESSLVQGFRVFPAIAIMEGS